MTDKAVDAGSTTELSNTDIAIVGGGMVGATLALLLATECPDWRITLIESFAFPAIEDLSGADPLFYQPSFDARSTAIAAGSVPILSAAGVWDTLAAHTAAIYQVHVSDKGHPGGSLIDCAEHGLPALGYVTENSWIGKVLAHRLQHQPSINCLAPATVKQLIPRPGGAELAVDVEGKRRRLRCAVAIIADGVDSCLRGALGIDVDVIDYAQRAIVANIALNQPHHGVAYERFTDAGPLALLPLETLPAASGGSGEGNRSALIWTHPEPDAEAVMALPEARFLSLLQQRFGYRLGQFAAVGKRNSYALRLVVAKEQVRSSVVVMGNAAHFLHPVAGQGFNLALRDCAALVETLVEARLGDRPLGELSVLQSYVHRQQRDQLFTTRFSDTITRLFSSSSLPAVVLRNLGLFGLDALEPAKNFLARQTMGWAGRQSRLGDDTGITPG